MKCAQDQGMNVNHFADNITIAGTLAFGKQWGNALNELALGLFCNGLLDSAMAEYVRRK